MIVVALPCSLIVSDLSETKQLNDGTMKKCPECAELIKKDAKVCRYCNKTFPEEKLTTEEKAAKDAWL